MSCALEQPEVLKSRVKYTLLLGQVLADPTVIMRKFLAIINLPHTTASRFRQVSVSLGILRKNKLLEYNNKYCP